MQRPGLTKKASATVLEIQPLTAVIALVDQFLLHQASG